MMEDTQKLTELRAEIDTIDRELASLLNKRARLSLRARIAKGGTTIYRPEREKQVLENITKSNKGPLSNEALKTLFQSIIFVCRSIQEVTIKKGS